VRSCRVIEQERSPGKEFPWLKFRHPDGSGSSDRHCECHCYIDKPASVGDTAAVESINLKREVSPEL
jgi:hypothetical protein